MKVSANNSLLSELQEKLEAIYPSIEFGYSSGSSVNEEVHSSGLEFMVSQSALEGTSYNIGNHRSFIHYTSIEALTNILNSQSLKLFSLNSMNDPYEFNALIKKFELAIDNNVIDLFKRALFVSSFCRYDEAEKDDFNMWRLYGKDGAGVGIVFEIVNENIDWKTFIIGKVDYDSKSLNNQRLKQAISLINHYVKEKGLVLDRVPSLIGLFLSLYKNEIWRLENEYRLLSFYEYNPTCFTDISVDNQIAKSTANYHFKSNGRESASIDFPLISNLEKVLRTTYMSSYKEDVLEYEIKSYPNIRIKEIIVGYQVPESVYKDLMDFLIRFTINKLPSMPNIKVSQSHIKNWFE